MAEPLKNIIHNKGECDMKSKYVATLIGLSVTAFAMIGCSASKNSQAEVGAETSQESSVASPKASESAAPEADEKASDDSLQKVIDAGVLKVGCKTDVPCFGIQNTATGKYEGLEVDLAYEIAADIFKVTPEEAKQKDLVEFQGVTAKTRGPLLDTGELDLVIATFTITEDRKKEWNFSTPYIEDALGLMCLKEAGYTSMKDIDGALIGVAQGATTKNTIDNYIKEEKLPISVQYEEFDGYPALSAALSSGNIDIFSVDRAILAGYNDDTTMILPERFGTQEYGVASNIKSKALAEEVDKVVKELLSSHKMDEMIKGWGIE